MTKEGFISEDYRKNLSLINRELKAINSFNNEEYVSTSNLKSVFSGISNASYFDIPQNITFFNSDLDSAQKKSVKKAFNSQDLCLIQGPPGTGKTNVIIEIIRQILENNRKGNVFRQKILLVSQAHPAVDKMLEDLDRSVVDTSIKVIRIGREENLTDMVKHKYAIDYVQSKWIESVINSSNTYLNSILNCLEIDKEEFVDYCSAKLNASFDEKESNDNVIKRFEEKNNKLLKRKDFKAIVIQVDWVNRLIGRRDIQQHFIKNSDIVAGTCTGFVSNIIISDMEFDYVIIDEAAKATFPELLISIIRAKKVIMVGDHKQLPPVLEEDIIRKNKNQFDNNSFDIRTLYNSIFEKLFEHIPCENKQILTTQYRMHPIIGSMISKLFYDNEISNGIPSNLRSHPIKKYSNLAIVWISTSKCCDRYDEKVSTTYRNFLEASIIKEQLKIIDSDLINCEYDVGVITPYNGQKILIRKEIQHLNFNNIKGQIVVNSVDAFQGGQKDIIIYSTVRSSEKRKNINFLKSKERLNVAFSRAKRLLIIIGDSYFLNDISIEDNKFPEILKYIRTNKDTCRVIEYEHEDKNLGG